MRTGGSQIGTIGFDGVASLIPIERLKGWVGKVIAGAHRRQAIG